MARGLVFKGRRIYARIRQGVKSEPGYFTLAECEISGLVIAMPMTPKNRTREGVNLKLTLAYDGGPYVGWQRQALGVSVQQRLEEALQKIAGTRVVAHGASRTDTGVHALGMVVSFHWPSARLEPSKLQRALNALLPEDIRVLKLQRARADFHARFEARWKLYRYRILNAPVADPFRRKVTWFIHPPLDLTAMQQATRRLVGEHHFASMAVNPGYSRSSMARHIRRCEVICRRACPPFVGNEIHVEVEGNSFLYKMVRTMVGTLVEVGLGKRTPESIRDLIRSRDRKLAGKTAPAHGLFLVRVFYSHLVVE